MLPTIMLLNIVGMALHLAASCNLIQWIMQATDDPHGTSGGCQNGRSHRLLISAMECENEQQRFMDTV